MNLRPLAFGTGYWLGAAMHSTFEILVVRELSSLAGRGGWSLAFTLSLHLVSAVTFSILFALGGLVFFSRFRVGPLRGLNRSLVFLAGVAPPLAIFLSRGSLESQIKAGATGTTAVSFMLLAIVSLLLGQVASPRHSRSPAGAMQRRRPGDGPHLRDGGS